MGRKRKAIKEESLRPLEEAVYRLFLKGLAEEEIREELRAKSRARVGNSFVRNTMVKIYRIKGVVARTHISKRTRLFAANLNMAWKTAEFYGWQASIARGRLTLLEEFEQRLSFDEFLRCREISTCLEGLIRKDDVDRLTFYRLCDVTSSILIFDKISLLLRERFKRENWKPPEDEWSREYHKYDRELRVWFDKIGRAYLEREKNGEDDWLKKLPKVSK